MASREEGEVPKREKESQRMTLPPRLILRASEEVVSEFNSIAMSTPSTAVESSSRVVAPPMPTPPPPSHPPVATGESDIDELASTVEDPPLGHLSLFKSVFGVGVSLAQYIVDDPLWPILAAAGLPCSFCVRSKKSGSCSVVPHLARCSNCDDKKPCILGHLARFLEIHGDPGQRTRFSLLPEQWKIIAEKIESSMSSTRALLELSPLDDQDRLEEDHLALQGFICHQPKLSIIVEPVSSNPPSPPVPIKASLVPKKRKRTVRVDEPSSSKRRGSSPNEASPPFLSPGVPVPSPPRVDTSYGV
ncbi:hypothetical protein C8R41DRAFT_870086 [Lentinula lateritia]|uniref:Uncharacterized protein n=1 Tax=Lentinula lateritia TaxID=40482 RepID=A0ABQ8V4Z1_9AGAR|nr:hypothetical protein C8R41DRAFT_870086 [Lentinula lateritia]